MDLHLAGDVGLGEGHGGEDGLYHGAQIVRAASFRPFDLALIDLDQTPLGSDCASEYGDRATHQLTDELPNTSKMVRNELLDSASQAV